ncbi:MAG: hypothetical protein AAF799_02815 [Myxococcota bacterium]
MSLSKLSAVLGASLLLLGCPGEEGDSGVGLSGGGGGIDSNPTPATDGDDGSSDQGTGGSGQGDTSNTTMPPNTTTPPNPDSDDGPPPQPPAACANVPVGGSDPFIDGLEIDAEAMEPDGTIPMVDGRRGFWFIYNDGSAGGTQEGGDPFIPSEGGAEGTAYAARTWGSGFTEWGAAMAVSLNNDFTGSCAYDASNFDGIGFWARGTGTARMHIATLATVPTDLGGDCDPAAGMCHDNFGTSVSLSDSWTYHEIMWGQLAQEGWGVAASFNSGALTEIHWQAGPGANFDIYVDELTFLGGEPGGGDAGDSGDTGMGSTG